MSQLSLFAPSPKLLNQPGKKFVSPVVIKRLSDTGEFRVSPRVEALKAQENSPLSALRALAEKKSYYTNDRADARGTAAHMLRRFKQSKVFSALAEPIELDSALSFLTTNPDKRPGAIEAIKRWKARQVKKPATLSPFQPPASGLGAPNKIVGSYLRSPR